MGLKDINRLINEVAEKYKLEGHQDVFGGMVWFVLALQDKECKSINDHIQNETFSFSTPRYNPSEDNSNEIYEIIQKNVKIIEEKLKLKEKK